MASSDPGNEIGIVHLSECLPEIFAVQFEYLADFPGSDEAMTRATKAICINYPQASRGWGLDIFDYGCNL